jgi:hypothetical protein
MSMSDGGVGDGGPAFPHQDSGDTGTRPGMTLRDYFAAKAVVGLLAQACGTAMGSDPAIGAKYAYDMADALLAARGGA